MAVIIYLEPQEDGKRLKVIGRAEAERLIYALNHPEQVTDEKQLEKLARIEHVFIGRLGGKSTEWNAPDTTTDHLTNTGIYQSRDMGIPSNDQ